MPASIIADAKALVSQHVPIEYLSGLTDVWNLVYPYKQAIQPYLDQYLWPVWGKAHHDVDTQVQLINNRLSAYPPHEIILLTLLITYLIFTALHTIVGFLHYFKSRSLLQALCTFGRSLPGISHRVVKEREKAVKGISSSLSRTDTIISTLPLTSTHPASVLQKLKTYQSKDVVIADGRSNLSGVVYIGDASHKKLVDEAYSMFSFTNPLHPDSFPSVRQMEAEVVSMTASILGGGPEGSPLVCGAMTSGGSESILIAMKAARDYMRATKGITQPEMVIAVSAHAAYFKAAEYFGFKLVKVRVDGEFRLTGRAVAGALTSRTAVVVVSTPGFPHGVIDCVQDIAAITHRRGIWLHVDACLGGFLLPFARRLGYHVPPFDFSLQGVSSMSVDTHKFGMASKGTSVVLYATPTHRKYQYTAITDWTGGLYISPGMAGSRPGGLIASAWSSLVRLGEEGLLAAAKGCMQAAGDFQEGLKRIPELKLVGRPDMSVVAFTTISRALDVFALNDLMTQRGWHLNALQFPSALHFCFTAQHVHVVGDLLRDLKECVGVLKAGQGAVKGGSAPLYGVAATIPDRELIGDFLVAFQDAMLAP